jgi:WD40 repeat protein
MARYALVVGISHYESEYFESLSKAIIDANAVANLLKQDKRYKNVEVLTGEVTGAKLVGALKTFLQKQAVKNEGLIYFTGHGFTVVDIAGETEGYLATSDCSVTIEDGQAAGQKGGLPLNTLNKLIHTSDLSNLVVLLDACHSGAFLERDLVEQSFKAFGSHTDYYLITGCRGFEEGIAKKREQHSVFTGALVGGLSQDNADEYGKVTGDRLFDFIYRELRSSKQEPIRMGIGRSIVLLEFPSRTKAVTAILDEKGEVICPYQGLQAFDRNQKEFFFGRKRLVETIKQNLDNSAFIPVIGASGSGKSSVVRAGLIPWLEEEGNWQILAPIKPGFEPLLEIRGAFKSFFRGKDEKQLKEFIEDEDKYPKGLAKIVERLPGSDQFLLVVDQFEEVFTVCPDEEERQRFIQLITQVAEIPNCRLSVVTTMRADFLEPCLRYPSLYQQIQKQAVFMPPLAGIDLRDAITEPARHQGYTIEEELVFRILEDVGKEPGFLPLLEFALTKLWHKRDQEKHLLTLEEYNKLGGLAGALDIHAEQVYRYRDFESDSPIDERGEKEQDWIKKIFLRLVRTGEQEKDTRQRQPKSTLLVIAGDEQEALSELLEGEEGLVQGRLLVTGQDTQDAEPWVDLAHEALIEGWHRLAKWRKENRDLRRLIDRLEDALREWKKDPKDDNLMMGGLLAQVREKWQDLEDGLSHAAKEFFQKSDSRDQEKIIALQQALLREQAARVNDLLSTEPVNGLVMAIQATDKSLDLLGEVFSPVQTSLHKAVKVAREKNCFRGHQSWVNCAAFIPNTDLIASGSDDKTIQLWNLQGEPTGEPFKGHESAIRSIAVSPKGDCIASCSNDKTIRLWNLQGISIKEPFRGHEGDVISIAFSPDGQYIVSGSRDKTIRLWDLQGEQVGKPFRGHEDLVGSVAFSPDGQYIVSGSQDNTIRLWDLQGNPLGQPFIGHEERVAAVTFSPDGQYIVSGSRDKTIRLWDLQGKQVGEPFRGHGAAVFCVSFSLNGQYIISGGEDRTIRVWNLKGEKIGKSFQGHQGAINSAVSSADGSYILSASEDKTIRLWDFQDFSNGRQFQEGGTVAVAFSPDSQCIVSAEKDGVQLWDLDGTQINGFFEESEGVSFIAFSPTGQNIVGGKGWNTIQVWDLSGNLVSKSFDGHDDFISSVAFSPDGHCIASSSNDGTIRLWNLQGKQIREPFYGHLVIVRKGWGYHDSGRGGVRGFSTGEDISFGSSYTNSVTTSVTASVSSIAFSPDGQYIVSGGDDATIRLWDLQGNQVGEPFYGHRDGVHCVAFSPDGQYIVSGGDDATIRLWDLQGNQVGESFYGHVYSVNSVAFSPDSQYIVSAGMDGSVRVWDLRGNPVGEPLQETDDARSVAFSPNGQYIISCSEYRGISLWKFENWRSWLKVACERLQNHSVLKNSCPQEAQAVCEVCQRNSFSDTAIAQDLVNQGKLLAYRKDFKAAINKFQKALELDPNLNLEPEVEVRRPEALLRVMQGRLLALKLEIGAALAKFQEALELVPDLLLDSRAELQRFAVPLLLKQGKALAEDVNVLEAIAKFKQAVELDPTLDLNPETEAGRLAAATLVSQAKKLVDDLEIEEAIAKFHQALELNPSLNLNPEAEAKRLKQLMTAPELLEGGKKLVQKGKVQEALVIYTEAQALDHSLVIPPKVWDELCRASILHGYVTNPEILAACDIAVNSEPENRKYRDTRGIARALAGDFEGAIEDFQVYINRSFHQARKAKRKQWIEALQEDKNPFTFENVKKMFDE